MKHICPVKKGYFVAQALMTSGPDNPWKFRFASFCLTSLAEAKGYINKAAKLVDGLELQLIVHNKRDLDETINISRYAREKGIDLWLCPRPYKYVFTMPDIPKELAAFTMKPDGTIIPAFSAHFPYHYVPDPLNPRANDFMMEAGYEIFWKHFRGVTNGYMWPEEKLDTQGGNLMGPGITSYKQFYVEHWRFPVYSNYSLEAWRAYCHAHQVYFRNKHVELFPVHDQGMVRNGADKTFYCPGSPEKSDFRSLHVNQLPVLDGVWKHWYTYLRTSYSRNHLIRLSRHLHDIYGTQKDWRGVVYFGSSPFMMAYEDFVNKDGVLPKGPGVVALGLQAGIDLRMLAQAPEIDYIIHESPPCDSRYYIEEFNAAVPEEKRGLMLHADGGGALEISNEKKRWTIINDYQPRMLSLYPLWNLLQKKVLLNASPLRNASAGNYFRPAAFNYFCNCLRKYQNS